MLVDTISHPGALEQIPRCLEELNARRVLLISGKYSLQASGMKQQVLEYLHNYKIFQFNEFEVNPKLEDAVRGAHFAKTTNIDSILAIGGGSSLDMAKIIKAIFFDIGSAAEIAVGKKKINVLNLPIIAVPTTAGSGSEETHFAVVYVDGEKFSLASPCLKPDRAILDGLLLMSLPRYQRICSGLDAIAQAIESHWAVGATPESKKFAIAGLEKCWGNFTDYVNTSKVESLQLMLHGANLAGQAINISKTTAAHAWSYGIAQRCSLPHGHAVWMTLPQIFQIHADKCDGLNLEQSFSTSLKDDIKALKEVISVGDEKPINFFKSFLSSFDLAHEFKDLGALSRSDRLALAENVNLERLTNNPMNLAPYKSEIFNI